eukprot:scaffold9874_cov51-Cyclotella_meneghiniana.AAC.4
MEANESLYFVGRLEDVDMWYHRYMNRKSDVTKKSEDSIDEQLDDVKFFNDHRNTNKGSVTFTHFFRRHWYNSSLLSRASWALIV